MEMGFISIQEHYNGLDLDELKNAFSDMNEDQKSKETIGKAMVGKYMDNFMFEGLKITSKEKEELKNKYQM